MRMARHQTTISIFWSVLIVTLEFDLILSLTVREDIDNIHPNLLDSNFKLKPVREVLDDNDYDNMIKDFPKIYPCGPDEAQHWFERDPDACQSYYECTGVWYEHRTCQTSLLFDDKSHTCNWAHLVECGDRPEPFLPEQYHGPAHHIYHDTPHDRGAITEHHQDHEHEHEHTHVMSQEKDEDYEFFM